MQLQLSLGQLGQVDDHQEVLQSEVKVVGIKQSRYWVQSGMVKTGGPDSTLVICQLTN